MTVERRPTKSPPSPASCHCDQRPDSEDGPMRELQPAVYILASGPNGTLYVGVTSDLARRVWQHRNDCFPGFTSRYGVDRLVYYELHGDMEHAIVREKRLKKWERKWKLRLVNEFNAEWKDLGDEVTGETAAAPPRHSREGGNPKR